METTHESVETEHTSIETEQEYRMRSDMYADRNVVVRPIGAALRGAEAAEAGREFLIREYGSEAAVERAVRRGRPRVSDGPRGKSPVVRGRVSEADFEDFKALEEATGRSQSELVREGVQLLLAHHRKAS